MEKDVKYKRGNKELIRNVQAGDKKVLNYPDDTEEVFDKRYHSLFSRASELNNEDSEVRYRIVKVTELRQLIIVAERRLDAS